MTPYTSLVLDGRDVVKTRQLKGVDTKSRVAGLCNHCVSIIVDTEPGSKPKSISLNYNGNTIPIAVFHIGADGTYHCVTGDNNRWSTQQETVMEFMIFASVKRAARQAVTKQKGGEWPVKIMGRQQEIEQ